VPQHPSPVLFLDVDGVVNVAGESHALQDEFDTRYGWVQIPVGTTARLRRLAERFVPCWATARHDALDVLAPRLGIGADWFSVRGFGRSYPEGVGPPAGVDPDGTWKIPAILNAAQRLPAGTPWAWVDDEIHADAHEHLRLAELDALLVTTDPFEGLTDEHVTALLAFADR